MKSRPKKRKKSKRRLRTEWVARTMKTWDGKTIKVMDWDSLVGLCECNHYADEKCQLKEG